MRYTESHEWLAIDSSIGTVGITEYAKKELGDIVYIELPQIGAEVRAGQEVCVLESTKAAVDVYSPASGKIIAVNEALRSNPSSLKSLLDQDGWLFQIALSHPNEAEELLTISEYAKLSSHP